MAIQLESDQEADPALTTGIFPPVALGLSGYWELQGTIDRARLNVATGVLASVVGSPVVEADGVTLSGYANYLVSDVSETDGMTVLVVGKVVTPLTSGPPLGAGAMLVSNFNGGGTANGFSLLAAPGVAADPGGLVQCYAFETSLASNAVCQETALRGAWRVLAGRASAAVKPYVADLTVGLSAQASGAGIGRWKNASPLALGSSYRNDWTGSVKLLRVAVYNRALSDAELATMRTWLAAQVALVDPGIVV